MSGVLSYDHGPVHYVNLRTEISLPDTLLKHYTGTYKGPQSSNVLVAIDGDHLSLTNGGKKFVLYAETKDRFFLRERDLTFTFIVAKEKDVQKLVVRENGNNVEELTRQ